MTLSDAKISDASEHDTSESCASFLPVVTTDAERKLNEALSSPFSYISTNGPQWLSTSERNNIITDPQTSHLVVETAGSVVGAVSWTRGQTPGFFSLSITSSDDTAWTVEFVQQAIDHAISMIRRSAEARRIELLVPAYNYPLIRMITSSPGFGIEGVLRERFFIDGRYWHGILCSAAENSGPGGPDRPADLDSLMDSLREKTVKDLTSGRDEMTWSRNS